MLEDLSEFPDLLVTEIAGVTKHLSSSEEVNVVLLQQTFIIWESSGSSGETEYIWQDIV